MTRARSRRGGRGASVAALLALTACGMLRQLKPSWTLRSEQVRLRDEHELFEAAVTAVAIDPSGRFAAIGAYDGSLGVFDLEDEKFVAAPFRPPGGRAGVAGIEAENAPAAFAALLSDGRRVRLRVGSEPELAGPATGPTDGTPSGRILRGRDVRLRRHDRDEDWVVPEPRATAVARRGDWIALASGTSPGSFRLRIYEGPETPPTSETPLETRAVALALHPTLSRVAVGGSGDASVVDAATGAVLARRGTDGPTFVAFDPAGRYLYALHGERLDVLSAEGDRVLAELSAHRSASRAIAASRDGTVLVTGGVRGEIRVWEVRG